jgi:hypothetical protein
MPANVVSEISSGAQFSRSSNEGQLADTATRVFRILMGGVGQAVNAQQECGIKIGDEHPVSRGTYCTSFDLRYEGDSRMVYLVTFQYQSTPSASSSGGGVDPRSQSPEMRPANWSISSSLIEVPLRSFFAKRTGPQSWSGGGTAKNSANDMYDGVTAFDALVTISIVQFVQRDPTTHARHVGAINQERITLGTLVMPPHTVMFRGLSCQPTVQSWGERVYRGWDCTYEFAYRANDTGIHFGADGSGGFQTVELGWDIALPQTGFNVLAFAPPGDASKDEVAGQPLKHQDGKIDSPEALPDGIAAGKKVRGMVQVFEYENGGRSQLPCAQPIALNDNGRPRRADLMPLVYGYQVHREVNLTQTLGLRLF